MAKQPKPITQIVWGVVNADATEWIGPVFYKTRAAARRQAATVPGARVWRVRLTFRPTTPQHAPASS